MIEGCPANRQFFIADKKQPLVKLSVDTYASYFITIEEKCDIIISQLSEKLSLFICNIIEIKSQTKSLYHVWLL